MDTATEFFLDHIKTTAVAEWASRAVEGQFFLSLGAKFCRFIYQSITDATKNLILHRKIQKVGRGFIVAKTEEQILLFEEAAVVFSFVRADVNGDKVVNLKFENKQLSNLS